MTSPEIQFPECSICFGPLNSQLSTPTKCGHIYHTECLEKYLNLKNDKKCPLCRQDATTILKLIFDIKFALPNMNNNENNEQSTIVKSTEEIIKENQKLLAEKKILMEDKQFMYEQFTELSQEIDNLIKKQETYFKREEQHKNTVLSQNLKIQLKEEEIAQLKQELINKDNTIQSLNQCKKELELTKKTNQSSDELMKEIMGDQNEILEFKDRITEMMNRDDGGKTLSEYIYVFEQKMKKLEQENEELKKKSSNNYTSDSSFTNKYWKSMQDNGQQRQLQKRTYSEFVSAKFPNAEAAKTQEVNKQRVENGGKNIKKKNNKTSQMSFNPFTNGQRNIASFLQQ